MSAKWTPTDDELDAVARTASPPELGAAQAEQYRTSLLARAAAARQLPRHSPKPIVIAAGAMLAAAATLVMWFGLRASEPEVASHADIVAIGAATFKSEQNWPSYVVRVDDGRVQVNVAAAGKSDLFVAKTMDARVEVRSSKFVIGADKGRITWLAVSDGRVELHRNGEPSVFLAAGDTWQPTQIAHHDVIASPPAPTGDVVQENPPPKLDVVTEAETQRLPKRDVPRPPARKVNRNASQTPPTEVAPSDTKLDPPASPAPPQPKPGELEFRAGVAALRAGDPAAAAKSFAAACTAARGDALAEDACFWVGAAAKRSGQHSLARDALTSFLRDFPSSPRAGEASALIGWILYDTGDLDGASKRFERAAKDPVPKVRESATRGLEAIRRQRP